MTAPSSIDAATLDSWLGDGREIALLDIREEGFHGWGHPLFSSNLPYSRLERDIGRLVPRRATRIVVFGEDGIVELAARRLSALGYTNVHVLAGGVDAWARAGHELFVSVYSPSKAFAEVIEHKFHTPSMEAAELNRLLAEKADLVVLDTRTVEEYTRFHVPGAISCPSAELVYRFADLVPSPDTMVVVSCAGRTRGIIGAQALRNARVPNRVASLKGGTQGWRLEGLQVEEGLTAKYGPVSAAAKAAANARAADLATRFGVPQIDVAQLAEWQADTGRTTYLFDIRTPEEYVAGHLPGAVSIPGGQLVQSLDMWAATRNARIVLADDAGVRAIVTAHWLRQIGWDAVALGYDPADTPLEMGEPDFPAVATISPAEAKRRLAEGAYAIAVDDSADYRKAHVDGALWVNRSRLGSLPTHLDKAPTILLFGREPSLSALVAIDLAERFPGQPVLVVRGGPVDWQAAGLTVVATPDLPADADRVDFLTWLHDRHSGNADSSRAYLAWEEQLPQQIGSPEKAGFRIPAAE